MVETCYCSRCHPTPARVQCSRCGEEIRWGERAGEVGYWHREAVDHQPILGHTHTMADEAAIQAALDAPRLDSNDKPYTTRDFDIARIKDREKREAAEAEALDEDEIWEAVEIPAPEVLSTPIEKTDPRLPGGAKTIWNLAEKMGWRVFRSTYSRGPVLHATLRTVLGIKDYFVLGVRLDDDDLVAVGSWCDNKFDFAYVGKLDRTTHIFDPKKVDSKTLKSLIKGETTS